ncbi:SDR family NAD(P)-dependent oxidoreductase [Spirillospora sp. NPDC052269]
MAHANDSRTVLLTGANGGVGLATARALAEKGFRVLAGVRGEAGRVAEVRGVRVVRLDVTDPASVRDAVGLVREHAGDDLYAVVNNAGIIVRGPVELVPDEEWRRQFAVNVFGPAALTRELLPLLRASRGRIVNITAPTARIAAPYLAALSASKAALASMSDALRLEVAPWGVSVIVVEPGLMDTPVFTKADAAEAEVAGAVPSELRELYRARLDAVGAALASGKPAPPSLAADAVVRALTASKPRPRYSVGADTRGLGVLAALPLRTRDRLLGRVLGLHKAGSAVQA